MLVRKFKVWDKMLKRFDLAADVFIDPDGEIFEMTSVGDETGLEPTNRYVIVWQTGRKDKNGKEIYEGDIGKPRSRFLSRLWEVYWDERVCQFRVCANGDRQFDKTHTVDWIDGVVGNIYENPEPLGKKETI